MIDDVNVYAFHGVELPENINGSAQLVTDCPFCGHEKHFFISTETAQFQCKDGACAVHGNKYTFLELVYRKHLEHTSDFSLRNLARRRKGTPFRALAQAGIAYDPDLQGWLMPIRSSDGKLTNLKRLGAHSNNGRWYSSPTCKLHVYGLDQLLPDGPLYLCEGELDAISLRWLLSKSGITTPSSILAVPGADNLPAADLEHFRERDVYLLYDNDQAGTNGMKTACAKLGPLAKSLHVLDWPPNRFTQGYDVDQLVRDNPLRPRAAVEELLSWCLPFKSSVKGSLPEKKLVRNNIQEVIQDFKDSGVHLYSGLEDALILSLAVAATSRVEGESVWMYLIGDSGAGKSLLLEALVGSPLCVYRTSITFRAFVSGYRTDHDNSLLLVLPGKTLVVKDYSNILSLPHQEQDQLVSLLREAFDGKISQTFGNKLHVEYPPPGSKNETCRFSMVAGVTRRIHAKSHAELGERFLKFEIPLSWADSLLAIHAAMDSSRDNEENRKLRRASVSAFLSRPPIKDPPPEPDSYRDKLVALVRFVGLCRAIVSRTGMDLDYDPSPEAGTRLAKQLPRLGDGIGWVLGLPSHSDEVYRLLRLVGWDTAHSRRRNLWRTMFDLGPSIVPELSHATGYAQPTIYRLLADMEALHMIYHGEKVKFPEQNRPRTQYILTSRAKELYIKAELSEV